ncbi:uncharacterized protein B0H18DRAFT_884808 [Fomitopsis serialis]|uniref:uncharacterized protein n=1 Tax=Fomitopsis serialis TaxID=139415 RepID=UPI0020077DAC|nr:uncharacterized protein B0H18DRAFT_884808 [Neoantrodia serialis]KAH9916434.1 hypothetical protein B0H18DRAFT_884808 [Neoantrodia serialis]
MSNPLKTVDTGTSSHENEMVHFEAIHFSWYNQSCMRGNDVLLDIPLRQLSWEGCSRTNYSQMTPYVSADMEDHIPIYQAMTFTLADMFSWVEEKLQSILPRKYDHLEATASLLPDLHHSLVHPFVGLVVNMNVCMYTHRDSKDDIICLVIVLEDFEGGKLCLVEPLV